MLMRLSQWACVGMMSVLFAGDVGAQLERVSPKKPQPPARPGKAADRELEASKAGADEAKGPALAGVRIVGSREEIQAKGDLAVKGIQVGPGRDLDILRGDEFRAWLDIYLGKPITDSSIGHLQRDIVRFYRDRGRPLVDVVVPEQESVGKGVLQVFVLEAVLGKLEVEGNKWSKYGLFSTNVRLRAGEPIDTGRLIEDVDWLNQNPGRHVEAAFKPGEKVGQSDVVLRVDERRPVRVYVGYEDNGPQFTGEDRVFAGFNWFNAFGLDHRFSYQYTTDVEFDFIHAHTASYEIPLPWRHTITVYGGHIDSEADFPTAAFSQEGTSYQVSVRYQVPLPRCRKVNHGFSAGLDFKSFDNNLEFGGVPVFGTAVDIAQLALAYNAAMPDKFGATALRLETFISPGDLTGNNEDADFATQRRFSSASYAYARLNIQRETRLPQDFLWVVRGLGQLADGNLQGSEQLGLGGGTTVRGYDEREANGDRGWLISTELLTPPLPLLRNFDKDLPEGLRLLAFWDHGEAHRIDTIPGEDPHLVLSSVGVGLRYNFNRNASVRFDYGWQIKDTGPANPHDPQNSRGHLAVQLSF